MNKLYSLKTLPIALITLLSLFANPTFAQSKSEVINTSYFIVFGRYPNRDEFKYWNGQPSSTIAQMVANHRNYLKNTAGEKESTIQRSYQDAFGWAASADELRYWKGQDKTYAELVSNHINNWLATNSSARENVIKQSYYKVFGRLPNASELKYWMSQSPCSYAQLVAFHTTWKMHNQQSSSIGHIQPNIQAYGISTSSLSPQAAAAVVAAGGMNVIAAGGGNVVAAGGMNAVAAGGAN